MKQLVFKVSMRFTEIYFTGQVIFRIAEVSETSQTISE